MHATPRRLHRQFAQLRGDDQNLAAPGRHSIHPEIVERLEKCIATGRDAAADDDDFRIGTLMIEATAIASACTDSCQILEAWAVAGEMGGDQFVGGFESAGAAALE